MGAARVELMGELMGGDGIEPPTSCVNAGEPMVPPRAPSFRALVGGDGIEPPTSWV
jgi:hypothetical protein